MKKSTLFLLAAAAVLAVVAFIVTRKSEPTMKKLDIPGLASAEDLAAEKKLGLMDAKPPLKHDIDEVIIERAEGRIHLVRDTAPAAADAGGGDGVKWRLTEPVQAAAMKYPVDAIIELFKTPTTRSDSRTIGEKDLPLFDLEASRRIGLTLKSKGAVWGGVDLVIGQVLKDGERGEETTKGTWVLVKGDETTAFLLADKDLRTAVDKELSALRDTKVFDFTADAVSRIEVASPEGDKLALTSTTTETPAPEGAPPDAKPTKTTTWALSEPAGVKGDASVSGFANTLVGLRAKEYVALAKATEEAKAALAGKTWKVTAKVGDKDVVLTVAEGTTEPIWARIEGKDELIALATYAADSVRKGLAELKDKTVFDLSPDSVTGLTLKGDAGPIELTKVDGQWKFVQPAVTYPADAAAFLTTGSKLTAVRWVKPSEREAAKKALATPDISATLKVGEVAHVVTIGAPEGEDKNRWAVVGDVATAEPFLLAEFTAKRFTTTVDALRHKKLFPKGIDQVASLSIQVAGATEVALLEKAADGGALTLANAPAGKAPNDEAIRTIVATLGALEAKTFHEGKAADVTGLDPAKATKLTLKGADGATTTLLLSTTSAGDGEVYALVDQGPLAGVPLGLNEYQAKNLAKPLADLVKDPAAPGGSPEAP